MSRRKLGEAPCLACLARPRPAMGRAGTVLVVDEGPGTPMNAWCNWCGVQYSGVVVICRDDYRRHVNTTSNDHSNDGS